MAVIKRQAVTSVGEDVGKREPVHCWWEWLTQPLWKNYGGPLENIKKVELPYDLAFPFEYSFQGR